MRNAEIHINLMPDDSEIIPYNSAGIPIYIRSGRLSMYAGMRSLCHWHEDLEFIRIHKGKMCYWVNGKNMLLKEGDCLVVNSRQMHYGYSFRQQDCDFTCIILHPDLLPGHHQLRKLFVEPLLRNADFEYLHCDAEDSNTDRIRRYLDSMVEIEMEHQEACELQIAGVLGLLFGELIRHPAIGHAVSPAEKDPDTVIRQNMISFIYQNYSGKIGLSHIANAGNVCRNKCCQIFKKYTQQSPIEFLNRYRLEVSRNLLAGGNMSVLEIAQHCGFNHSSYYSKLFYRAYRCTPTEYRKSSREQMDYS
ncbi:MAG: AraC family transcriptional regulator [Lachnospiraceae bacterium]|nr:AraC family transcriptional regulator [Lachnospiraceae bacterium]